MHKKGLNWCSQRIDAFLIIKGFDLFIPNHFQDKLMSVGTNLSDPIGLHIFCLTKYTYNEHTHTC